MKNFLNKLGVLNDDGKFSITNVVVLVFVAITAFRSLFSGVTLNLKIATWTIQSLDISSVLPVLFSLLNYSHKRMVLSNNQQNQGDNNVKES